MKICILGWYGTETLGDRAIIEGIIKIFNVIEENNEIYIGSLYPFFTERTLIEEQEALVYLGIKSRISYFDVRIGEELKKYIKRSDIVIMGGGPLMDLLELDIIDKAFVYAKKENKKTGVIGCGIGPLKIKEFRKSVYNILKNSDLNIFRDKNSLKEAKILNKEFSGKIDEKTLYSSFDPAIIPIAFYKSKNLEKKNRVVVNFRDLNFKSSDEELKKIRNKLKVFLKQISNIYEEVLLLPNHIFNIGGDDRLFFSSLKLDLLEYSNIIIEHHPKSLFETFKIIEESKAAIGMRYHAILFQTFLNGNNYILDYTDFKKGKIKSFLVDIDKNNFYENRYYSLSNLKKEIEFKITEEKFEYDFNIFTQTINFYIEKIKAVLV